MSEDGHPGWDKNRGVIHGTLPDPSRGLERAFLGPSRAVLGAPRGPAEGAASDRFELHAVELDQRLTETLPGPF
eukprot:2227290-Pyramimonas_sp.AAC.1